MKFSGITTFLVLLVAFSTLVILPSPVEAAWQDKYNQQSNEINNEIKKIEDKMAEIAHTIEGLHEEEVTLEGQMEQIKKEISTLSRLILETSTLIRQKETQIETKKNDIRELEEDMAGLIRQYQIEKNEGLLIHILSSKSLGGFLAKLNNISNISGKLDGLAKALEKEQELLEGSLKELELTKKTLDRSKALSRSKRDSLVILTDQIKTQKERQERLKSGLEQKESNLEQSLKVVEYNRAAEKTKMDTCLADTTNYYDFETGLCKKIPVTVPGNYTQAGYSKECGVNVTGNIAGVPSNAFVQPTTGYVTQNFGCTPYGNHDGADVADSRNTVVKATANGKVVKVNTNRYKGYGYSLVIKHTFGNRHLYSRYGHLNSMPLVGLGSTVTKGQTIGYMGTTGFSSGVHLHFSITDESYESTGNTNCNSRYGYTSSYCFNPFNEPFNLFK